MRPSDAWLEQFMVGDPEDDGIHVFPPSELSFAVIDHPSEWGELAVVVTPTKYMQLENGEMYDESFQIAGLGWDELQEGLWTVPEHIVGAPAVRSYLESLGMTEDLSLKSDFEDDEDE